MNERYSRQILFREIGRAGQEKLLNSRVLIVGCGALGASHAEMLARAGVGKLRIVDRDFVETNTAVIPSAARDLSVPSGAGKVPRPTTSG